MISTFKNRFYYKTGLIALILILSYPVFSQQEVSVTISENAVKNLVTGINSENEGLKRSCIYMAGKYKIEEAINALSIQMKMEFNPNNRILIALSLFQIGSDEGLSIIKKASMNDTDVKVKNICTALYNALVQNNYSSIK